MEQGLFNVNSITFTSSVTLRNNPVSSSVDWYDGDDDDVDAYDIDVIHNSAMHTDCKDRVPTMRPVISLRAGKRAKDHHHILLLL